MSSRSRVIALAALGVATVVAFLRRPVRRPKEQGTWSPADRQRSHR